MKRMGIKTVRLSNHEVIQNIDKVTYIIEAGFLSEYLFLVPPPGDRGLEA
jgi:hypothetical protein